MKVHQDHRLIFTRLSCRCGTAVERQECCVVDRRIEEAKLLVPAGWTRLKLQASSFQQKSAPSADQKADVYAADPGIARQVET